MASVNTAYIAEQVKASIDAKQRLLSDEALLAQIAEMGEALIAAYKRGNKVLIAGNGGSAADAQHIAAEFVSRFNFDRPGLPALALTTDTSIITAIGNDYGYDKLFERQIQANGVEGDIFIGISTSGNSANILLGLAAAKAKGIATFGLAGQGGGKMKDLCEKCICAPSSETPRIQEVHILVGHILCSMVEDALFSDLDPRKPA